MINREERINIINELKKKKELLDKLDHNKNEVKRLQGMADAATNIEAHEDIKRAIRKGECLISTQTTALTKMSAAKIARKFDVPTHTINHQWKGLTGVRF